MDDVILPDPDLEDEDLVKSPIIDPLTDDEADLDPEILSADALAEEEDEDDEFELDDDES